MPGDWTTQTLLSEMLRRGDDVAVTAFVDSRQDDVSYASLARNALGIAHGLLDAGAQPGERVLIIGPNQIDWITVRLAVGAAGLVTMPLDDLSQPTEITSLCEAVPPRWAFCSQQHAETVQAAAPETRLFILDGDSGAAPNSWRGLMKDSSAPLPPVDPSAPTVLSQTSGTTGPAKLFTLSHDHLSANVSALAAEKLVGVDDRLLLPLPLHHIYPQVVGLLTSLTAGATIVLPASVTGPAVAEALQKTSATGVIAVPRLYEALVSGMDRAIGRAGRLGRLIFEFLLSSAIWAQRRLGFNPGRVLFAPLRRRLSPELHLLVSGGARLDEKLTRKLSGLGFDIRSGYGLAETASTITGNLPGRERLGSEGRPFQGGEVRIDQPDESGIGEVQLRGPNVFAGYLDAAQNKATFTEDGWFRSGDLGRLDEDGFLYVVGRFKETLVLGSGKKILPEEMEKLYGKSPYVAEIAVLEHAGSLVALVRPDDQAIADAGYTRPADVVRVALSELGESLASYQRLAGFALVRDPLPRTRLGKFRRFLLPDLYQKVKQGVTARRERPAAAGDAPVLPTTPRGTAVWRLLEKRCGPALTAPDDHLALDLGIDSLGWVSLSLEIEQQVGVDMSDLDLAQLVTVDDLVKAVEQAPERVVAESPEAAREWMAPAPAIYRAFAALLRGLNRLVFRTLFGLRVIGAEHLPARGSFVIVCNHVSDLDPMTVAAALPAPALKRTHWGAAPERLFDWAIIKPLYRALKLFPLNEAMPTRSLASGRAVIDQGDVLVWFPESWRSPDGRLQAFLPGIGHLLAGTDVAVVPACVEGTFEAMPRGRRWPRLAKLRLRFGSPVTAAALAAEGDGDQQEQRIANALHERVGKLLRETA